MGFDYQNMDKSTSTAPCQVPRGPQPAPQSIAVEFEDGHWVANHQHDSAQLLYAVQGFLVIGMASGRWVLPSNRALWIPPNTEHWTRMVGDVQMRSLYLEPGQALHMPHECCVVEVSALLKELILAAVKIREPFAQDSRNGRLMGLLLDELTQKPLQSMHLPTPSNPRLARVCRRLIDAPDLDLNECASEVGVNPKTVRRWFVDYLGMSFGKWRRQARVLLALEQLATGKSVLDVALATGYSNHSAFSAMFRSALGVSPSEFLDQRRDKITRS